MSVQIPEDQVEFLGRYLLAYVDRHGKKEEAKQRLTELESQLTLKLKEEKEKKQEVEAKEAPKKVMTRKYEEVLHALPGCASKAEAFDQAVHCLETILGIPYAYVGVKEVVGESEEIKYVAAGPNSQAMRGKKLAKPAGEEAEDAPERQGVSFEAFKLPEVPEGEEEEEPPAEGGEEGEEPVERPPKAPPAPQPLTIVNTMRDKRVKFFGLPKLGAYVAYPFIYPSLDHDAAVVFNPGDAETPPVYSLTKKDAAFLIGIDSIGQYRQFEKLEVERVGALGLALIDLFQRLETSAAEATLTYLQGEGVVELNTAITDFVGRVAELETNALAEAAAAAAAAPPPVAAAPPAEGEEGEGGSSEPAPPVEGGEFIKAQQDTAAVLRVWSAEFGTGPFAKGLAGLAEHLLPLPNPALRLLYALGCLFNLPTVQMTDESGDPSWDVYRKEALPTLSATMAVYDPTEEISPRAPTHKLAAIRAYVEANGLLEAGNYPVYLPVFASLLLPWLQKALAAREAASVCAVEVRKISLEGDALPPPSSS